MPVKSALHLTCLLFFCQFISSFSGTAQPAEGFEKYTQKVAGAEVNITMIPVKGGTFIMGSQASETGRDTDEGPAKQVTVSPFWMGANEVTYDEYDAFFKDEEFCARNNRCHYPAQPALYRLNFGDG